MKIGITGTRYGLSDHQKKKFLEYINSPDVKFSELHHGDCIGVDAEIAKIVSVTFPDCFIVCHPPKDEEHRAFTKFNHKMREPKTHFARNRSIVEETDLLLVFPLTDEHQTRGGTWYTHDYAKKVGKPIHLFQRSFSLLDF